MGLIIGCIDPELGDLDSPNPYIDDLEKVKPKQLKGSFHAGLDLGKQVDHSVLAFIQKIDNKRRLIYKHQFPLGTPYSDVIGHIAKAHQIFNFQKILIDKTGVGDALIDEIQEIGIENMEGLFLTDPMERRDIHVSQAFDGAEKDRHPRRRQATHRTNQRTTI